VANHFNPAEPRDWRGRWSKVAGYLQQSGIRAPQFSSEAELVRRLEEFEARPTGDKFTVKGVVVRNHPLRVRINGVNKQYFSVHEAAHAIVTKQHSEHFSYRSNMADITARKRAAAIQERKRAQQPSAVKYTINKYTNRTPESDAIIRAGVEEAANHQRQFVPDLVDMTHIDINNLARSTSTGRGSRRYFGFYGAYYKRGIDEATGKPNIRKSAVDGHMSLTKDIFLDENSGQVLRKCIDDKWWVGVNPGHSLAMTVQAHEYGHGIHGLMAARGYLTVPEFRTVQVNTDSGDFWEGLSNTLTSTGQIRKAGINSAFMDVSGWFKMNRANIRREVSQYAGTNMREMLAELWCEYTLSDNPRPAAKFYGDYVMSKIGKGAMAA
jgi:hypothetical protein